MYLQSFVHAGKYNTNYQQYDIETVNYYLFPTSRWKLHAAGVYE